MKTLTNNSKIIFGITIGVIILPLFFYYLKFGSLKLSSDFEDWVHFSTYWSPYLVAALTIVLAYISWQSLELMKLKEKPVLVIEEYPEFRGEGYPKIPNFFYRIKNLGQGPSMNMKLSIRIRDELIELDTFLLGKHISNGYDKILDLEGFHYMVHSFSLQPGEDLKINWQFNVKELAVVFDDLYGSTKNLLMNKNVTDSKEFDSIGIDKFGMKNSQRIFSNEREFNGKRLPKRIFTLEECYSR